MPSRTRASTVDDPSATEGSDPVGDGDDGAPAPVEVDEPGDGRRGPSVNTVVALGFALVGLRVGLVPLHDNSFFTHLATGRLILENGAIPRRDPYSFTAHGDLWTVQSWGASVIYALTEKIAGVRGIQVLVGVLTTALALLAWHLTKPAKELVGRIALAGMVVVIGATFWVERPLLFGLLFLFAVLFAVEDRLDPRWLLPVMWLWVNIHGSFPLGLAALVLFALGRRLDRQSPRVEVRALAWALAGTLLGAVNPLGPRLLVFPLQLLERREAFSQVVEWQPPHWSAWGERFFAVQLAVAVVLFLLRGRSWRAGLPMVVFAVAAATSLRNIPQASLVLIPGMTVAVAGLGSLRGERRAPILRPVAMVLGVLCLVIVAAGLRAPETDLSDYPVEAIAELQDRGGLTLRSRVVTRDFVGNYLEVRYGPDKVRTYFDDRVDMYPLPVIRDYSTLIDEQGDYAAVLRRAKATAVVWDVDSSFGRWLDRSDRWKVVFRDDMWLVAVPEAPRPR